MRPARIWKKLGRGLVAIALVASACGEDEPALVLPEMPVPSGFEVNANAFAFPNYGGVRPDGDLTSSEVTRMFGRDGVCADSEASCRLTPIAREFATNANASMQGGRCEGFAVLTGLMYLGKIDPGSFGGTSARALMLEGNADLAREISYWFSTQYLKDVVKTSTRSLNAAEAVSFLAAEYVKPDHDLYRIGMVRVDEAGRRVGGHAILAVGVTPGETKGQYLIEVYDNNHPAAKRSIKVDSATNRWEYQASTNPNQQASLYVGDPANKNKLFISGIRNRAGTHACPFCRTNAMEAEQALSQIFTFGSAETSATDAMGRVAGEMNGQFVTDIPDAVVTPGFSEDLDQDLPPTMMLLPPGKLDLSIRRRPGDASGEPIRVAAFLGGSVVGIENGTLAEGQTARIEVSADRETVKYFPAPGTAATVFSAVEGPDGKQTLIRLQVPADKGVEVAAIGFDAETGNATLSVTGAGDLELPIEVTRSSSASEENIDGVVAVPTTGSTTLLVEQWMGQGESLPVATDRDGDGTPDESGALVDRTPATPNECLPGGPGLTACGPGSCTDTPAAFYCTCPAGFSGSGTLACADVDECGTSPCGAGTCTNAVGSFTCTCPTGYTGTGTVACAEVDECAAGGAGDLACGAGTCENSPGSYTCTCPTGYTGTGTGACADVDECAAGEPGTLACGAGTCDNTPGAYTCTCPTGYGGTGSGECFDVDECAPGGAGIAACGPGSCDNSAGGFACTCPPGFTGTGTTACSDLDECAPGGIGAAMCGPGTCDNLPGLYACTCPEGSTGTGTPACTPDTPEPQGLDCEGILAGSPGADDATYLIDPDGPGPIAAFEVFCDMTGGGWTLIFDQDSSVAPGYRTPAEWLAGVTDTSPGEGQWSALQHLGALGDFGGGYTFRMTWDDEETGIQWRQTTNPLIERGLVVDVTMLPTGQEGAGAFAGLGPDGTTAALDGEDGGGASWWAIGTGAAISGGIPAYNASSDGQLIASRTRLYVKRTPPAPRDCGELLARDPVAPDGIYLVDLDGPAAIPLTPVACDMAGGGWTLVSDQAAAVPPGYREPALWLAGVDDTPPNGGQWSILQHLRAFTSLTGSYRFRMTWDEAEDRFIEWEQDSNPLDGRGTVSNITMVPANQVGTGAFQGLASDGPAALDGEPGAAYSWAVGTLSTFGGGIPAYDDSDTGTLTAARTRLYFRR